MASRRAARAAATARTPPLPLRQRQGWSATWLRRTPALAGDLNGLSLPWSGTSSHQTRPTDRLTYLVRVRQRSPCSPTQFGAARSGALHSLPLLFRLFRIPWGGRRGRGNDDREREG